MAPIHVTKTYANKKKAKKRARANNIHTLLSGIQNKENSVPLTVSDALFAENIKNHRPTRCKMKDELAEESNDGCRTKYEKKKKNMETENKKFAEDFSLDSTFDRILAGPMLQQPNPLITSRKSNEFNSSTNSENQFSSLSNCTLFPRKYSPKVAPPVLKSISSTPKIFEDITSSSQQHRKSKRLTMYNTSQEKICLTSTPKNIKKKNKETSPYLSPIPNEENDFKNEETSTSDEQTNEVKQVNKECDLTSIAKRRKSLLRQSLRRLSHVVVLDDAQKSSPDNLKKSSQRVPGFREVFRNYRSEFNATLFEEDESVVDEDEEPVPSCQPDILSARDYVLQLCQQSGPISFCKAFPPRYWLSCKKIGEGVYGEVFMSEAEDRAVLKIIPIEGEGLVNGEPQKKFEEISSEIVIAMQLSNLRSGILHRTESFSEVKRCVCVQGKYPAVLMKLWDDYDEEKGSENDSPVIFTEEQLYIILVLANGGCDLESHIFTNAHQTYSVLMQIAFALGVAEHSLQFEHRDLHWGNVLVSPTSKKYITYTLFDREFSIPTKGLKVTIIDFTLSRMSYDGCVIFNDLSKDPTLFTAKGDYQFEVYRLMQKCINNNWGKYDPFTNILWLHYLVDKMCSMVRYRQKFARSHSLGLKKLKRLQTSILIYGSAYDFAVGESVL